MAYKKLREHVKGKSSPKVDITKVDITRVGISKVDSYYIELYLKHQDKLRDFYAHSRSENPCYVLCAKIILDTPDIISQINSAYRRIATFPVFAISSKWLKEIQKIVANDSRYTEDMAKAAIDVLQSRAYSLSQITRVSARTISDDEVTCMLDIAEQCIEKHPHLYVVTDNIFLAAECKEKNIHALTLKDLRNKLDRIAFWKKVSRDPRKEFANGDIDWGTLLDVETYSLGNCKTYQEFLENNPLNDERFSPSSISVEQHSTDEKAEDNSSQELGSEISDWIRKNLTLKRSWDWFGLIYLLHKTGQLGEGFNAEKVKRDLEQAYPNFTFKVPSKLSVASHMLYVDIVNDWTLIENAQEVWMGGVGKSKDFGKKAAEASFHTIQELLPSFAASFQDKLSWK